MYKNFCSCAICQSEINFKFSEYDLHFFVGAHKANQKSHLDDFESDLIYASVTHWDVGFCGKSRYYIYRDDSFKAIAWYDVDLRQGFK